MRDRGTKAASDCYIAKLKAADWRLRRARQGVRWVPPEMLAYRSMDYVAGTANSCRVAAAEPHHEFFFLGMPHIGALGGGSFPHPSFPAT